MIEYIMLNIIAKIATHYIKKGREIEGFAVIAEIALDMVARNEMERL